MKYSLKSTDWNADGKALYAVRRRVFVEEQRVPEELEQDEFDASCWHVIARDNQDRPIGTARLLRDGHIGRVAVVPEWRGRGLGKALMESALAIAKEKGFLEVQLHAQTQALDFYENLGFEIVGEEFMEAGIPHRRVRLKFSR